MQTEKNFFEIRPRSRNIEQRWYVEFAVNGKRLRRAGNINRHKSVAKRLEAAERLIVQLTLEFQHVVYPIQDRLLDLIEQQKPNYRKKTYQAYISKVNIFNQWIGEKGLNEESVAEFFYWLNCNRSNATYMKYLDLLRMLFRKLDMYSLLAKVESVKIISTPAQYFQKYQIEMLKKDIESADPDVWLCCQLLYYCFIRPGEQRQLRVGDILFDDWKIRIPAAVAKNKRTQMVTVPHALRPSLEPLKQRGTNEYIFQNDKDATKMVAVNSLSNRHRKFLNARNFSNAHKLYSWKHTGAINAVKAGVRVKDLQVQLRHSSLQQTDIYLRQLGVYDLQELEAKFPAL